jgi:hypothetical protein
MKTYKLAQNKDNRSKLAASYEALCQPGKIGEGLIRNGCGQQAFARFAAEVMARSIKAGQDVDTLAATFSSLALGNASQARQAIGSLDLIVEGEKAKSVSAYWNGIGGAKPIAANLDFLTS